MKKIVLSLASVLALFSCSKDTDNIHNNADRSDNYSIYAIKSEEGNDDFEQVIKIDPITGKYQVVANIESAWKGFFNLVYLEKQKSILGIFVEEVRSSLLKVNLETGKSTKFLPMDFFHTLVKDNQDNLYGIISTDKPNSTNQIVKINTDTGEYEVVTDIQTDNRFSIDENPIYLKKEKSILVWSEEIQNSMLTRYKLLKINIETGKVTEVSLTTADNDIKYGRLFQDENANVYTIKYIISRNITQIVKIDLQTGKEIKVIELEKNYLLFDPVYLNKERSVLGLLEIENFPYNLLKVNLETGKATVLTMPKSENEKFSELIIK